MRGNDRPAQASWRDPWIAAALLAALAVRIALARGGLWLDEAWSAVLAHEVGTPVGVLSSIHHDNNHPLNSWWLQFVGLAAPPLLARALSIGCSVATVIPAARLAARRGPLAARAAAALFALSPMLVLLGSEARGYAPMLLALMLLIDRVDPARADPVLPSSASMALAGLLGTLGHLLMLPALILVAVWLWLARGNKREWRRTLGSSLAIVRPALTASLGVAVLLLGWAYAVQGGLTIGSTTPFSWQGAASALADVAGLALGWAPLALLVLVGLFIGPRPERTDLSLWLVLGVPVPVAVLLFHPANSHIARYYLLPVVALLLVAAIRAGAFASGDQIRRPLVLAVLGATLAAMSWTDARLIAGARGAPDAPVRTIAREHPAATRVLIGSSRLSALVTVAAAEQGASVVPVGPACVPADYLLVDLEDRPPPPMIRRCRAGWTLADHRLTPPGDGSGWALYRRAGLPVPGPVASGPRPAL